jgi:hypothetical protein
MMQGTFSRDFAVAEAVAAEQARASRDNVRLFAEMLLSLGPDCLKLAGTRHDAELAKAKAIAAGGNRCSTWSSRFSAKGRPSHSPERPVLLTVDH